jgi:hypothetical protein
MIRATPAQAFMDKVDGRPGAVAIQSGHLNAYTGVPMASLRLPFHGFTSGSNRKNRGENQ